MLDPKLVLVAALLLGGCTTAPPSPAPRPIAAAPPVGLLPAAPSFMGPCAPSAVKEGMAPNAAFDLEHSALKECSLKGARTRAWYLRLRQNYPPKH